MLITTELGAIKGTEYVMRGNLGLVSVPMKRVQDPEKIDHTLVVNLDLTDLSKFKFPTITSPHIGSPKPQHLGRWLKMGEIPNNEWGYIY